MWTEVVRHVLRHHPIVYPEKETHGNLREDYYSALWTEILTQNLKNTKEANQPFETATFAFHWFPHYMCSLLHLLIAFIRKCIYVLSYVYRFINVCSKAVYYILRYYAAQSKILFSLLFIWVFSFFHVPWINLAPMNTYYPKLSFGNFNLTDHNHHVYQMQIYCWKASQHTIGEKLLLPCVCVSLSLSHTHRHRHTH
jgi:hypothetical protein